jgi:LPXTG-motif cell wall-anchored protein
MRKLLSVVSTGLLALLLVPSTSAAAQSGDGTVTVVHGVPDLVVDVYVNGDLTLEDFAPSTVTDPITLPAGDYDLAIRPAGAAADSDPAIQGSTTLPAGANASVVAHLGADGQPTLTVFVNDLSPIAAGQARLVVRHTAAAPAVDVLADGAVAFGDLTNPNQATADLPAGTISAAVAAAGTTTPVLGPVDLDLPAGAATIVYAVGSLEDGSLATVVQTIAGLGAETTPTADAAAPTELPRTGTSMAPWLLAGALGLIGAGVALARRATA